MNILNCFTDLFIDATIMTLTEKDDGTGNWAKTLTPGTIIQGIKWNRSNTERFFNITWAADVSDFFVTGNFTVTKTDKLQINGVNYSCELPEDVAEQGEVNVIGLRSIA